jgi:RNA polymerase sigma factor (sigma-70 family)
MNEFTADDLKSKDEGALAAFYKYLAPKVRKLIARVLHERHELEVDEVVNEVFLRVFSHIDQLTKLDNARKVEHYCLRAAHNIALENLARLEKEDAIVESYESQLDVQMPTPLDIQVEKKESLEMIQSLLTGLSPYERKILEMYLQGMNAQEISNSLNMDAYETRYNLNKLKAKLRYRFMHMQKN